MRRRFEPFRGRQEVDVGYHVADLSTLANLAEIFGAFVVLGGLGFAVIQMHHYRQQRRETAAIELLRSFQNPEFSRSLRAVLVLPKGLRKNDLEECSDGEKNAIMPLEMVNELLGGVCVESWSRLHQYMQDSRAESDRKTMGEWFQWLAERLDDHHTRYGRPPAYEQYRHWRS